MSAKPKVYNSSKGKKWIRFWSPTKKGETCIINHFGPEEEIPIIEDVRERDVIYVLDLMEKAHRTMKDIRDENRRESKKKGGGGGGDNPPYSGIFHRLIDEDKMANCIQHIVDNLFHGEKECEICKVSLNLYDFCLLMFFYFEYIHILKKTTQLAFCTYLRNKVYGGHDKVNVRNFNIYAKKDAYTNFHNLLKNKKDITFSSRPVLPRPKTEHYLLAPFQEIGWKFHYSPYFDELRHERETVDSFAI